MGFLLIAGERVASRYKRAISSQWENNTKLGGLIIDKRKTNSLLSLDQILDLTDGEELLAGILLRDLEADVIKIEKPCDSLARSIGPFYRDDIDLEERLFWFAFNTSKRGITLNIETADRRKIFEKPVKGADCVIESFPPGYMDELGTNGYL